MDTEALIEQGNLFFAKGKFEEAFSYYHQAHMQNDPYGTYEVAECFRIAFHRQNLDNVDFSKCREYAKNAIDLYAKSYKQFKSDDNVYKQRFCDDILVSRIFMKRLINDSKRDLPEETLMIQRFQENENEYLNFPYNEFAMLLSADIHRKVLFLLRLTKDHSEGRLYITEKYLRIAASVMAYKHCCSEVISELEADEIVQALMDANHLGAKFDISNLYEKMEIEYGKRPPDEPGIWSYDDYDVHGDDYADFDEEKGFCDDDGFYCSLDDWYPDE